MFKPFYIINDIIPREPDFSPNQINMDKFKDDIISGNFTKEKIEDKYHLTTNQLFNILLWDRSFREGMREQLYPWIISKRLDQWF